MQNKLWISSVFLLVGTSQCDSDCLIHTPQITSTLWLCHKRRYCTVVSIISFKLCSCMSYVHEYGFGFMPDIGRCTCIVCLLIFIVLYQLFRFRDGQACIVISRLCNISMEGLVLYYLANTDACFFAAMLFVCWLFLPWGSMLSLAYEVWAFMCAPTRENLWKWGFKSSSYLVLHFLCDNFLAMSQELQDSAHAKLCRCKTCDWECLFSLLAHLTLCRAQQYCLFICCVGAAFCGLWLEPNQIIDLSPAYTFFFFFW